MMHREVAAIVLCVLAQAASAQCVATPATAAAATVATTVANAAPATQPPAHGELIKTAAAGTRDDMPPVVRESARAPGAQQQEHPRRGSTAMLLAALALMSGIALRRYSSHNP